jgi:hypothetical protein
MHWWREAYRRQERRNDVQAKHKEWGRVRAPLQRMPIDLELSFSVELWVKRTK